MDRDHRFPHIALYRAPLTPTNILGWGVALAIGILVLGAGFVAVGVPLGNAVVCAALALFALACLHRWVWERRRVEFDNAVWCEQIKTAYIAGDGNDPCLIVTCHRHVTCPPLVVQRRTWRED